MDFDWDRANIEPVARHSTTPEEIEQIFANNPVDIDFATVKDEERWTIIGHTNASRFFFVVFTMRDDIIRPVQRSKRASGSGTNTLRRGRKDSTNMPMKAQRPIIPNFATEAEEAQWWDDHHDMVEEEMMKAIQDGTVHVGGPARILQERRESKDITIRVPIADLERAREQAQKRGLAYDTYIEMLLHEALDRQDAASQS